MQTRLTRLEWDAQNAERVTEELQARLREKQMELRGQEEVLVTLVKGREAEEAAELQVTNGVTYSGGAWCNSHRRHSYGPRG